MNYLLPFAVLLFIACSNNLNTTKQEYPTANNSIEKPIVSELEKDTVTVILSYYGWACPCPQWITPENKVIYTDASNKLGLFWNIKPINDSIKTPFDLTEDMGNLKFEFKGQFYTEPQFLGDEGEQGPAKTLLYSTVKHIK